MKEARKIKQAKMVLKNGCPSLVYRKVQLTNSMKTFMLSNLISDTRYSYDVSFKERNSALVISKVYKDSVVNNKLGNFIFTQSLSDVDIHLVHNMGVVSFLVEVTKDVDLGAARLLAKGTAERISSELLLGMIRMALSVQCVDELISDDLVWWYKHAELYKKSVNQIEYNNMGVLR